MNGTVWFFIEITLSDNPVGKQAVLSLGRIDDADITWINGVEVGRTTGYQKERLYAFDTGILKKAKMLSPLVSVTIPVREALADKETSSI